MSFMYLYKNHFLAILLVSLVSENAKVFELMAMQKTENPKKRS